MLDNKRGFFLVEIGIAVFLLMILLGIMGLLITTYQWTQTAAVRTEITYIAQAKMQEIKAGMVPSAGHERKIINQLAYDVSWDKSLLNEARLDRLYLISVVVEWKERDHKESILFSTYLLEGNADLLKPRW